MTFVTAKLLENEVGAMYEEDILDRWLTLELSHGRLLKIFDSQVISNDLLLGNSYEFILYPLTFNKKYADVYTTFLINKINSDWNISLEVNLLVSNDFIRSKNYSVVELEGVGGVLMKKELFNLFESEDKKMKVVCGRFDLYGVKEIAK